MNDSLKIETLRLLRSFDLMTLYKKFQYCCECVKYMFNILKMIAHNLVRIARLYLEMCLYLRFYMCMMWLNQLLVQQV